MTKPVYRLAIAQRGTSGLGTVITGLEDVLGTIGFRRRTPPLTFDEELNGPGELEFSLPIDHADVTRENFKPGAREVHLYRDEVLVWGGKIWTADVLGWYVRFKARGWYHDLTRRFLHEDYASVPTAKFDQFKIVHQLLNHTQGYTNGNLGITEYVNYNTTPSGVERALAVCVEEFRPISDIIEELAEAKNGFDFAVLPDKTLRLWYPQRGSAISVVTFDAADNVSDFAYTEDATDVANRVSAAGDTDDCAVPNIYVAESSPSQTTFGLLEESVSVDDVKNEDDMMEQTAEEYLSAHKHRALQPKVSYVGPLQDVATVTSVAFDDYEMGDTATVESSRGPVNGFGHFSKDFRIIGRHVTVDEAMNEDVELTMDALD